MPEHGGARKVHRAPAGLRADHRFRDRHPRAGDIWLAIEVADASLTYDRGRKSRVYASSGAGEYWLLDVQARALEVRRDPGPEGYATVLRPLPGERVAPAALPDCAIDWAQVFA